jgi:hypothetical protein
VAFTETVAWYLCLHLHRGATHFKSTLPQPKGSSTEPLMESCCYRSPSIAFNVAQSWLAPFIALGLWGLLPRAWYYFALYAIQTATGLRAFRSIVLQRLSTLKHVASIVSGKAATKEQERRRRAFLKRKALSLMIDLLAVFFVSVALPGSMLLLRSMFNSRQFAIHATTIYAMTMGWVMVTNAHLHVKIKASNRARRSGKNGKVAPDNNNNNNNKQSVVVSLDPSLLSSALSVVRDSDV